MDNYFAEREAAIPKGVTRTRFAPSPTGYMHVGGLRTALYSYLIAKRDGGRFLLRIEDTDQERFVEGAVESIIRILRGAGLQYDEGPDTGGPAGPYIQSERREIYAKYAELLIAKNGAYRCFCQKEPEAAGPHERGHCPCRDISPDGAAEMAGSGKRYAVRQRIPEGGASSFCDTLFGEVSIDNAELDDGILIKSDGMPTYNFANVVDDHLMGITHIVRGTEFLVSTPKYNLLYESFGWEAPVYIHVAPVMKDARRKLSKRHGDPTYEDLIDMGFIKEAVLNYVALLGWSPGGEREKFTLDELAEVFTTAGLSKSPAIFDTEKLSWLNGEYLRELPPGDFYELALPYIQKSVSCAVDARFLAELLQGRCGSLSEIAGLTDFIDALPEYDAALFVHKKMKTDETLAFNVLESVMKKLSGLPDGGWTNERIHDALMEQVAELGLKNGQVLYPVRAALSGKASTPGGGVELCVLLGMEESLRRMDIAVKKLQEVSHL